MLAGCGWAGYMCRPADGWAAGRRAGRRAGGQARSWCVPARAPPQLAFGAPVQADQHSAPQFPGQRGLSVPTAGSQGFVCGTRRHKAAHTSLGLPQLHGFVLCTHHCSLICLCRWMWYAACRHARGLQVDRRRHAAPSPGGKASAGGAPCTQRAVPPATREHSIASCTPSTLPVLAPLA